MPQVHDVRDGFATKDDLINAWHSLDGVDDERDPRLPTRPQMRAIVQQHFTFAARAKLTSEDFFEGNRALQRLLHVLGRNESYESTDESQDEDLAPAAAPAPAPVAVAEWEVGVEWS